MRRLLSVAVGVVLVALTIAPGCPYHNTVALQRKTLTEALPAVLDPGARHTGDIRVAKVRVLADADFRGQNVRWQKRVTDELDYASQVLAPMLGVRLEVVEFAAWDYHAPGASLTETLAALTTRDTGDDVAFVIAFTGALQLVSSDQHELGMAELLGRHIVIRGFADLEERKAFARAFPDLPQKDQEEVLEARRRHKQTTLILHELGHTLGAIHETDATSILHAMYTPKATAISPRNRELMEIALADRLKVAELRDPLATRRALLTALEVDWGGWVPSDREDELALLRAADDAGTREGTPTTALPASAQTQLAVVGRLTGEKRFAEARAELDALIAAYPASAELRMTGCQIALVEAGPNAPPTQAARDACVRASELAPDDPSATMLIAGSLAAAGDRAGARAELVAAATRIAAIPGDHAPGWAALAKAHQQLGNIALAEDAATRAGEPADGPVRSWAAQTRARYGAPREGARWKLTSETEADYVQAVRGLLDLVYASKYAEATKAAAAADKRWPGAPGIGAARCDLAMRQGQRDAARAHCARAVKAFPDDSWALYLLGVIQLNDPRPATGIATLRKAIAVDPTLAQAWRALAKGLRRAKDTQGLADLATRYQAQFGQALRE
ncbi:MAG: tetratricopeptide repeat protein [Deltaproteobacteria bacterium]|nr:tetratricopeptide repeat protein [Deltaproteobacteria bacterium]